MAIIYSELALMAYFGYMFWCAILVALLVAWRPLTSEKAEINFFKSIFCEVAEYLRKKLVSTTWGKSLLVTVVATIAWPVTFVYLGIRGRKLINMRWEAYKNAAQEN